MKNTLQLFFILFALSFATMQLHGQQRTVNNKGYYEGVIRIKLQTSMEKAAEGLNEQLHHNGGILKAADQGLLTGITALDNINSAFRAATIRRVFRHAGKYEARHKKFGLHLWYEITFNGQPDLSKVLDSYGRLTEIYRAEPLLETKKTDVKEIKTLDNPPNDPRYSDQWHYENTGQNGGTPGSDISLSEAWTIETGSDQVIVAIEDGGIDFSHEDIAGNMWNNPGEIPNNGVDDDNNGYIDDYYGYNFAQNTGNITVDSHGTHVAGTVAAETNNGIGVSGIAGGTGNNDGVRLMSCCVFAGNSSGGFAEAYAYAADNGAVISQNSWGYTSAGSYEQAVLDGIDYFIANAGGAGAAMDGGIVIVAAGNDGTDNAWYPGYYAPTLAVSATSNTDQKAWYSNFGTWVDIAAPGGETAFTNDPKGVLSTTDNNTYSYYQGTSMACPHVSGVAALLVSHFQGNITATEVRNRLTTYVDDIDNVNPSYIGELGSGRLNAFAALSGTTPPPPPPSYCPSKGSNASYEWIAGVQIGAFTNNSGAVGYTDFTNLTIDLAPGTTIDLTLTPGFSSSVYNEYWRIWIDYNGDYDFDDAGELAFDAGTMSSNTVTGSMLIPALANGNTRMRVSMKYNGSPSACETFSYGEVEDYTVSFSGTPPVCDVPDNLTTSNVTYNSATLNWNAAGGANSYEIQYKTIATSTWITASSATNSVNISNLTPETTYEFQVKTLCDGGNSDFSAAALFTTTAPPVCDIPSGLSAINITYQSATLLWNNVSLANSYEVEYRAAEGTWFMVPANNNSLDITSLSANTLYEFHVRSLCDYGTSDYSGNFTFNTSEQPSCVAPDGLSSTNITSTAADLSWNIVTEATSYNIQYRTIGDLSWIQINNPDNTIRVTNLVPLTEYEFQVSTVCSFGSSAYSLPALFTTQESTLPDYCSSYGINSTEEFIQLININGTENNSGNDGGYGDYTHLTLPVSIGTNSYGIQAGYSGTKYRERCIGWIDFNRDGDFDDTGETLFNLYIRNTSIYSGSFTVPSGTTPGIARMRISIKYRRTPTPCEVFSYGEVEDYNVMISATSTQHITSKINGNQTQPEELPDFVLFPNPARDQIIVSLDDVSEKSILHIYDAQGRLAIRQLITTTRTTLSINSLAKGLYTIKVSTPSGIKTKRFIKE